MPGITHATVIATGVDSGDQVSKNAWNAEHTVPDGALAQAAVAGLVADLAGKQAAAAILAALAALDGTAGILRVTGAGTVERLTDTVAGRALLEAADAAAQRTALGLGALATLSSVGTAQIADGAATYAKIQAVGANKVLGSIAGGVASELTCTAAGRDLLDDADAAAQRATLGLGTAATTASTDYQPASANLTSLAAVVPGATGLALLDDATQAGARTTLGLGTAATTDATAYATAGHDHAGVYSPATRTISTTAPLSGGGDLSGDRTLTVATFGAAQAGVVPASGGGTSNFLRADGTWSAPGGGSPGGSSGLVQYNNAGAFGGAANLSIDSGDLVIATGTPTTPSAGSKLYSLDLAGRAMLAQIDANGVGLPMQASLARARVGHWNWPGGSTAPIAYGIVAPTIVGTAQIRTPASTNLFTSMRRGGYLSAASAGSLASIRSGVAQFWRGNAAGLGGFYFVFRFGTSDPSTVAGAREFVGLSTSTGAATNVEPDTLVNSVGVGQLSTSSNLHFIHNDVGGTATTIDLGVNFPADTLSADMYELMLYAPPNGSSIAYRVERLGTSYVAPGTVSSNIPSTSTFLGIQMWRTNNATALGVALDAVSMYVETNY